MNEIETDVFVVGGGPAGLATAIACRMRSLRVVVVDYQKPPIGKACGEGILPDGVCALRELGIDPMRIDGCEVHGIRFVHGDESVEAKFRANHGLGVERRRLHQHLIERAGELGAVLLWRSRLRRADGGVALVDDTSVRYRWLIGADGVNSWVRRHSRLASRGKQDIRFGFRCHYRVAPWTEFVEVHWGDKEQLYVTPIARETVCVALVTRNSHDRIESTLPQFPALAYRLNGAQKVEEERVRGTVTVIRKLRSVVTGSTALVGDAAGSIDAVTGQGINLAFRQAIHLADAIARNDVTCYAKHHTQQMRRPLLMSRLMVFLGDHALLRTIAFRVMQLHRVVFGQLLAFHVGVFISRARDRP